MYDYNAQATLQITNREGKVIVTKDSYLYCEFIRCCPPTECDVQLEEYLSNWWNKLVSLGCRVYDAAKPY